MKKTLAPLLLAAASSGCTGSSDRPPAPIAPDNPGAAAPSPTALAAGVPTAAPTSVPTADPTSDADDEPPGAPTATPTSTPWGEAPAFKYSAAPKPPPKDLGPDARPLRFTKHVALKNLSEL